MALYKILFMPSTEKDFKKISHQNLDRINKRINALVVNPRPPDCRKLMGQNYYRIRQGDYRIIYEIRDDTLVILVIKVGHRRDVYRSREEKGKYSAEKKSLKNKI